MRRTLKRLAIFVIFLIAWEMAFRGGALNPLIFGSPSQILKALRTDHSAFLQALRVTGVEIFVAAAITCFLGISIGVLIGVNTFATRVSTPILSVMMAIPFVLLYPVIMAWFGIGYGSKVAYGVVTGIFPILLNTIVGVRSIDRHYVRMAVAMGASRRQQISQVVIPLALPFVIGGLRLGLSLVVAAVVLAEMLASLDGLGYWISYHRSLFNTGHVYLGIILVLLLTYVIGTLIDLLEWWAGVGRSNTGAQVGA